MAETRRYRFKHETYWTAKLMKQQEVKELVASGLSYAKVAKKYGVTKQAIHALAHKTYKFTRDLAKKQSKKGKS